MLLWGPVSQTLLSLEGLACLLACLPPVGLQDSHMDLEWPQTTQISQRQRSFLALLFMHTAEANSPQEALNGPWGHSLRKAQSHPLPCRVPHLLPQQDSSSSQAKGYQAPVVAIWKSLQVCMWHMLVNPTLQRTEFGGYPQLHGEFEASLDYLKCCSELRDD